MNASRNIVLSTILSGFAILLLETGLGPLACAVPIKAECSEIQARIDYGNLTEDQLRFATGELEDCHGRQKVAEQKDSGIVDSVERKFTPLPQ